MSVSDGNSFRVVKRAVLFGNPALGTYQGEIQTIEEQVPDTKTIHEVERNGVVAMVGVPPEQVPEGILSLAASHRQWIRHLRILIAAGEPKSLEAATDDVKLSPSKESKEEETTSSSSERSYIILIEMTSDAAAREIIIDLFGQPYFLDPDRKTCNIFPVARLHGIDGVGLLSPFFASPTVSGNKPTEDYNCAVCLEALNESSSILTTVCNHTFHTRCILQWQDSPCPVCRYDHSGLNEALSSCSVCGTTENNFVCLICGVVSCGGMLPRAEPSLGSLHCIPATDTPPLPLPSSNSVPQNHLENSHAKAHYDQTLHAYALNIETQHVWDFVGQGFVHRLLQNKDDGKLVEVSDPNSFSEERTLSPGPSQAQMNEAVHRKLEGFASQYYTLLKSQLEQQRIYFEGRLEEIRREYASEQSTSYDLIAALKMERQQLTQRLTSIQSKTRKVRDDVAFIKSLNESLQKNQVTLKSEIEQAQQEREESRRVIESCLPPLQEKVTKLMLQLTNDAAHG